MKRLALILVTVFSAMFMLVGCCGVGAAPKKPLVVYYTWSTGENTKLVAETIQKKVNGDICEIKLVTPYPKDYSAVVSAGQADLKTNDKPALEKLPVDLADYDTVYVGSPIWFASYSSPLRAFLLKNDLSGKKVIPFCTYGNGGPGRFFDDVAKLCPNSTMVQGFSRAGAAAKDALEGEVSAWLEKNGLL